MLRRTRTAVELMTLTASGAVAYLALATARHFGAAPVTCVAAAIAVAVFAHQILSRLNTRARSRRTHRH